MARSTKTPSRSPPSSQDRGHFAQIPLLLLQDKREGITSYTLAVYAAVQSFCTFGTNTDGYPSTEQLAERAGCSVRQVKRERSRLYMLGYLSWSRSSRRLRYTYKVHPDGDGPGLEVPNRPLEEGAPRSSTCLIGPSKKVRGAPQAPLEGPHRHHWRGHTGTTNREPVTERQEQRSYVGKCSHGPNACCPECVRPNVVSKPVSPPSPPKSESQTQDEEDFPSDF